MTVTSLSGDACRALQKLVADLAAGDFAALENDGRLGRLTADDLRRELREYGRTLVPLPDEALQYIGVCPLKHEPGVFAVDVTLWTVEEGRSDLTLQATVVDADGRVAVAIDDLRVL